jgi:hypothetical protein
MVFRVGVGDFRPHHQRADSEYRQPAEDIPLAARASGATQLPSTRSSCPPPARGGNAVDYLRSILQIARRKR